MRLRTKALILKGFDEAMYGIGSAVGGFLMRYCRHMRIWVANSVQFIYNGYRIMAHETPMQVYQILHLKMLMR